MANSYSFPGVACSVVGGSGFAQVMELMASGLRAVSSVRFGNHVSGGGPLEGVHLMFVAPFVVFLCARFAQCEARKLLKHLRSSAEKKQVLSFVWELSELQSWSTNIKNEV